MKCGHDGPGYSRSVIGHAPGTRGMGETIPMSAAHDEGRVADEAPVKDRGRYRCLPSAEYSPYHHGYPTPQAVGEIRLNAGLSNPVPGSDWSVEPYNEVAEMGAAVDMQMIEEEAERVVSRIAREIVEAGGPRAKGFNYGSGNTNLPSLYFDGVRMETTLNRLANEASKRAWAITTAVRNVRLAETPTERIKSEVALERAMQATLSEYPHLRVAVEVDQIADTIEALVPEPHGYTPHMGIHYALRPIRNMVRSLQAFIRQN